MARIQRRRWSANPWLRTGLAFLALSVVGLPMAGFGPNDFTSDNMVPQPNLPKNNLGLPPYDANVVLVAFKASVPLAVRHDLIGRLGLAIDEKANNPYFYRLMITEAARKNGATVETMIKALLTSGLVRVAEHDWTVTALQNYPNDPRFNELYGMNNTGQTGGTVDADIDAPQAWAVQTGSPSVKVCVIDTGFDYTHEDIAANAWTNPGEIPGNGIDDDGNGYIDDVHGYDFINHDGDPMDDNEHGTHCSGTIGGRGNNGIGVAGVCWRVTIFSAKFLSAGGSGQISDAVLCTDYARIAGATVMSNSWGGGGFSQLMLDAITRADTAGILYVAAAGNNSSNNDTSPFYPASYTTSVGNMVVVGATDHNDQPAGFSNFGATTVDLYAPGVDVLSSVPAAINAAKYTLLSGTSMATPHVAGAAALLKAQFPGDTAVQLKARLRSSAESIPALAGRCITGGRLNVYNSMDNDSTPPGQPGGFVGIKRSASAIRLQWTASGDDGSVGTASQYDLRVSTSPINSGNFTAAKRVTTAPAPAISGTLQNAAVTGLNPNTTYYFALRAQDNVGNLSPIGNAGPYTTLPGLYTDNMEGAVHFAAQGGSPWALTTEDSSSATHSWTDSPGGTYANNINWYLQTSAPIAITGPTLMKVNVKSQLEKNYDYLYIEASTNGVTWDQLYRSDDTYDWTSVGVNLSQYVGQSVNIRFRLTSDVSVVYDGVHIDDLTLISMTPVWSDNAEGAVNFSGTAPWALTTESSASPTHSYTDSPGGQYVNNLDISLIQNAAVSLPTVENPQVFFKMSRDLEANYDYLTVYTSSDNGATWFNGGSWTGSSVPFSTYSANGTGGSTMRLRFRMTSDVSVVYNGVYIDDVSIVGEPCEAITSTLPISGTITLLDWQGAVPGVPITVEVRAVGSTTPLETLNTTLGAGGAFTVNTTVATGNYDIAVKAGHWLRKVAINRTITGGGLSGVNLSLKNGDLDGDNEVAIGDYAILSSNFGGSNPVADVNGDGDDDIGDYAIISANFGQVGDD